MGIKMDWQIAETDLASFEDEDALSEWIYNEVYTHHSATEACDGLAGAIWRLAKGESFEAWQKRRDDFARKVKEKVGKWPWECFSPEEQEAVERLAKEGA